MVVEFKAGYGDTSASVPNALRAGIMAHVAQLWTHRGDNDFAGHGGNMLAGSARPPAMACGFYDKYRILSLD